MQTDRGAGNLLEHPAGIRAGEYAGYEGYWIANAAAEIFIGARPRPRVLVFRRRGGVSSFRTRPDSRSVGVRTWFMEPEQDSRSSLPAEQPAVLTQTGDLQVTLAARPDPTTALQLCLRITLDPLDARACIEHTFVNHGTGRTLAAWVVMAFPAAGAGFSPFGPWAHTLPPDQIKVCLFWPMASPTHPALELGRQGLGLRFAVPGDPIKVGLKSRAGAAVHVVENGWLLSTVVFDPAARYPEGDGNVTMFHNGRLGTDGLAELEHVGPLTKLSSGEQTMLRQELRLLEDEPLSRDGVDSWVTYARQRMMIPRRT